MNGHTYQIAIALILAASVSVWAQAPAEKTVPVTPDNFNRAESDMYFGGTVKAGGFGKLHHAREIMSIEKG